MSTLFDLLAEGLPGAGMYAKSGVASSSSSKYLVAESNFSEMCFFVVLFSQNFLVCFLIGKKRKSEIMFVLVAYSSSVLDLRFPSAYCDELANCAIEFMVEYPCLDRPPLNAVAAAGGPVAV